jgi:hypothetical protein
MEAFVDGLKVLSSGSLIVDSEQKISFKIGSMTFVFDFQKDDSRVKNVIQNHQDNTMYTHLINFNSSVGTGMRKPNQMATLSTGEKLYFSFAVYSLGDSPKIFHYTWLTGPGQQEGGNNE